MQQPKHFGALKENMPNKGTPRLVYNYSLRSITIYLKSFDNFKSFQACRYTFQTKFIHIWN